MRAAARAAFLSSNASSSSSYSSSSSSSRGLPRTGVQWHGSVPEACVDSNSLREQRRLSKAQRRVLVKDFVDRHRTSNEGRFPSPTHTRQCVGGSYYTVKEMIQELEYNYKRGIDQEFECDQKKILLDKNDIRSGSTRSIVHSKLSEALHLKNKASKCTESTEKFQTNTSIESTKAPTDASVWDVIQVVEGKATENLEAESIVDGNITENIGESSENGHVIRGTQIYVEEKAKNVPVSPYPRSLEDDCQIHALPVEDLFSKTVKSTVDPCSLLEKEDRETKSLPLEHSRDISDNMGPQISSDDSNKTSALSHSGFVNGDSRQTSAVEAKATKHLEADSFIDGNIIENIGESSKNGHDTIGSQIYVEEGGNDSLRTYPGGSEDGRIHDIPEADLISKRVKPAVNPGLLRKKKDRKNKSQPLDQSPGTSETMGKQIDSVDSSQASYAPLLGEHSSIVEPDASPPKKPDIWGSLKALADGFMSFWKTK